MAKDDLMLQDLPQGVWAAFGALAGAAVTLLTGLFSENRKATQGLTTAQHEMLQTTWERYQKLEGHVQEQREYIDQLRTAHLRELTELRERHAAEVRQYKQLVAELERRIAELEDRVCGACAHTFVPARNDQRGGHD